MMDVSPSVGPTAAVPSAGATLPSPTAPSEGNGPTSPAIPPTGVVATEQPPAASPTAVATPTPAATEPGTVPATPDPMPALTSDTLRSSMQLIGLALNQQFLDDATYQSVAAREFNYVTAENEMKWDAIEPTQGQFSFDRADQIVDFAESNGMQLKGHTLVWHSQLPAWAQNLSGAQAVRSAITGHIQGVLAHYRDRSHVIAWDVVNEAVDDAAAANRNGLRDTVFYTALGETFIDEAFQLAKAADPDALLLYNDYGIEGLGGKSDRAFALIQRLLDRGVPIDGVGFQMHVDTTSPTVADIRSNIERYAALGLRVNISELDVTVCEVDGSTSAKLEAQRVRYDGIVRACIDEPGCDGITVWGLNDQQSWLNDFAPCGAGQTGTPSPLLFDPSYQPKPAYQAVLAALLRQ